MSKTKISASKRARITNRDGRRCLWCGRGPADGVALEVDHMLAEAWGGGSNDEELGTLCNQCNGGKSDDSYGNYLLATLFKVRDLFERVEDINHKTSLDPRNGYSISDGIWHEMRLTFFRFIGGEFREQRASGFYLIHNSYLPLMDTPDIEIRIAERKRAALFVLKNKLRDYLFKNHGYLDLSGDMIIFRERK